MPTLTESMLLYRTPLSKSLVRMYVKGMQKALNGHCIRHSLNMVGKSDARSVGTFTFTSKTNKAVDNNK